MEDSREKFIKALREACAGSDNIPNTYNNNTRNMHQTYARDVGNMQYNYPDNRYNRNEGSRCQQTIKKPTTKNRGRKYTSNKRMKSKIAALALTGLLITGVAAPVAAVRDYTENKYVSNFEEMQNYNIDAQDLQISPETYERVMSFTEKINDYEENNFKGVSNPDLADCYSDMADLYLDILKEKISTVTGKSTYDFSLVAPEGGGDTKVKDKDMVRCQEIIESNEIDGYMADILNLRQYARDIHNDDINRNKLENKLNDYKDKLGEVTTINFIRDSKRNGMTTLKTYRIETRGLQQNIDIQQENDKER